MPLTVEVLKITTPDQDRELWEFYSRRMADIETHAVQAHVMPQEHFREYMDDPELTKYVVYDERRNVVGLSVMTTRLESWGAYISPAYFRRHYPEHYAQRRIFYIGFVAGDAAGAFAALLAVMTPEVNAVDGIAVLDWSSYNRDVRHLDGASAALVRRLNPTLETSVLDTQQYVLYSFAPGSGQAQAGAA